jgi:hypothetical protein
MAGSRREAWRRRSDARKRRGRGPEGPLAHQEVAGEVAGAGGGRTVANSAVVSSVTAGETTTVGGDSGLLRVIPRAGRKRAARRS